VWTIGAEVLHPRGIHIESLDDLASLLTITLGNLGGPIFYVGVFAALYTSIIGLSIGFGYLVLDATKVIASESPIKAEQFDTSNSRIYQMVVVWCLFSPLIYVLPNMPSFIFLTILASAATVIVLPVLCGSLWYLTSSEKYIGSTFKNKWWENLILCGLFILAVWGAYQAIIAITNAI
jgi:hypothetical protein